MARQARSTGLMYVGWRGGGEVQRSVGSKQRDLQAPYRKLPPVRFAAPNTLQKDAGNQLTCGQKPFHLEQTPAWETCGHNTGQTRLLNTWTPFRFGHSWQPHKACWSDPLKCFLHHSFLQYWESCSFSHRRQGLISYADQDYGVDLVHSAHSLLHYGFLRCMELSCQEVTAPSMQINKKQFQAQQVANQGKFSTGFLATTAAVQPRMTADYLMRFKVHLLMHAWPYQAVSPSMSSPKSTTMLVVTSLMSLMMSLTWPGTVTPQFTSKYGTVVFRFKNRLFHFIWGVLCLPPLGRVGH